MGNTNLWKNNKKNISDWPIKSCSSNANFFANQKPVSMLIWFWQVICVHTNLIRLEIIKKNVYLDKFWNHATMFDILFKKFLFLIFEGHFNAFFKEMLFIYASEPFKFAHSCAHSEHERMCVVMTNRRSFTAFKEMYIFLLHTQSFHVTCLSPLNTLI